MTLTTLEKEVFADMLKCNPGVKERNLLESYSYYCFHYCGIEEPKISYRAPLVDIAPLSRLTHLEILELDKLKARAGKSL